MPILRWRAAALIPTIKAAIFFSVSLKRFNPTGDVITTAIPPELRKQMRIPSRKRILLLP